MVFDAQPPGDFRGFTSPDDVLYITPDGRLISAPATTQDVAAAKTVGSVADQIVRINDQFLVMVPNERRDRTIAGLELSDSDLYDVADRLLESAFEYELLNAVHPWPSD